VTEIAQCLRCGRDFERHHSRHLYCSRYCRYGTDRGERPTAATPEQLEQLFDPSRDPEALVDEADWHPNPYPPEFAALENEVETIAQRRRQWLRSRERGWL
jgi:hypothetical protein